jgi:hypothetical protein
MQASTFNSHTQYDKKYDKFFTKNKKGYACSIFSLLTVQQFFNNKIDLVTHCENIDNAVQVSAEINLEGTTFEQMITKYTNLNKTHIQSTSVDLIKDNIIGFDQILPDMPIPYATIILKNEVFFVVMFNDSCWHVRDCHVNVQQIFKNKFDLINYLNETYHMIQKIDLMGDDYAHYSSVEFLVISEQFKIL